MWKSDNFDTGEQEDMKITQNTLCRTAWHVS